jgi:UDP-3-O-[3-hydroxymyristoyl] glucosamine N-acyltransferase
MKKGEATMTEKETGMAVGPHTAGELAQYLGCPIEGDADVQLCGVSNPENAGPADLIYVDSPRNLERAARSGARCVITSSALRIPGKTLLPTPQPKFAFARASAWLSPPVPIARGIHPTAVISPAALLGAGVGVGPFAVIEDGAEIGAGTEIGAFCIVGRNAKIGSRCRLYPRVTLYPGVHLGDRVIVHAGAVLGADGFGYAFDGTAHRKIPQVGGLRIEDDVEIGANSTIDRATLGETRIRRGSKIDNLVQVGHNVSIGRHCVVVAQSGISGSATLEDFVLLGARAGIDTNVTVGEGAQIAGTSIVHSDVPPGARWGGTPAKPLKIWFREMVMLEQLARRKGGTEAAGDA